MRILYTVIRLCHGVKAGHTITRVKFRHLAADRVGGASDVVVLVQAFHARFWCLPAAVEGIRSSGLGRRESWKVNGLTSLSDWIRRP